MPTEYLWASPAAAMALGYLFGSVPFGLLLTRRFGAGDLRRIGSGSIGATNVLRTGRKELAAATLVLDAAKGTAAVLIAGRLFPGHEVPAAAAAFLGHLYPVWLRFAGGKGLATLLGIALALYWPIGLAFAVVWLALFAVARISSVAGLAAAISTPIAAGVFGRLDLTVLFVALALLAVWRHRANIARLAQGNEPRVGSARG